MGIKRTIKATVVTDVELKNYFDEYLLRCKAKGLSDRTLQSYIESYNKFVAFVGEDIKASEINEQSIYRFINYCQDQQMMKPTSINHYLRELRAFFKWCFTEEAIKESFKIPTVKEKQEIKETYTEEELDLLMQKPHSKDSFVNWRTYTIINFIIGTGARASTICNIKLGDLNFKKAEIVFHHTKNKKESIIPMSRSLSYTLTEYIRIWRANASDDSYLFCNIAENQLTVNALKHSIRDYNLHRGVNKTSTHAFRHTFAKHWVINTGDVFRLQKMLGHSTLEMTRRYVNMFDDDLKENFDEFNPLDRMKAKQVRRQAVKRTA